MLDPTLCDDTQSVSVATGSLETISAAPESFESWNTILLAFLIEQATQLFQLQSYCKHNAKMIVSFIFLGNVPPGLGYLLFCMSLICHSVFGPDAHCQQVSAKAAVLDLIQSLWMEYGSNCSIFLINRSRFIWFSLLMLCIMRIFHLFRNATKRKNYDSR